MGLYGHNTPTDFETWPNQKTMTRPPLIYKRKRDVRDIVIPIPITILIGRSESRGPVYMMRWWTSLIPTEFTCYQILDSSSLWACWYQDSTWSNELICFVDPKILNKPKQIVKSWNLTWEQNANTQTQIPMQQAAEVSADSQLFKMVHDIKV